MTQVNMKHYEGYSETGEDKELDFDMLHNDEDLLFLSTRMTVPSENVRKSILKHYYRTNISY